MKRILFLLFILCWSHEAWGTVYWVSQSGGSTGDCGTAIGATDPSIYFRTITAAINCIGFTNGAGAGHIVRVKSGSYPSIGISFPSGTSWNSPFILESDTGAQVVVNTSGGGALDLGDGYAPFGGGEAFFSWPWYVIIRGNSTYKMKFSGAETVTYGEKNVITINGGHDMRFEDVEIAGDGGAGVWNLMNLLGANFQFVRMSIHDTVLPHTYGIYWGGVRDSVLEDSEIYNIDGYCVHGYNSGGLAGDPVNGTIRRTRFTNCSKTGSWSGGGTPAAAMVLAGQNWLVHSNSINNIGYAPTSYYPGGNGIEFYYSTNGARVYNNTIINTSIHGITSISYYTNNIVRNNLIWNDTSHSRNPDQNGKGTGAISDFEINGPGIASFTQDHNLCDYRSYDSHCTGTGTIEPSNPGLTNISGGDFSLQSGSPAKNIGLDLSAVFILDINGVQFGQEGMWDVGTCEWFSGTGICPSAVPSSVTPPTITIAQPAGCVGTSDACTVSTSTISLSGTSFPGSP